MLENRSSVSIASNGSLPSARGKVTPQRHHYQRSTKSSSAKVVTPIHNPRLSSSLAPKRPNHPNLRSAALPTPLSTPSLSSSSESSLSGPSDISTDSLVPPRLCKRSHSPTATPPRSPEWIYRRPKSPSTPPAHSRYRRRPEMNRSASESSTSSLATTNYFSDINSSSPLLPSPSFSYSETPESPRWTSLLRPRKRSGSVTSKSSANTSDIPSLWFSADDGVSRGGSRFSKSKKPSVSPLTTHSPVLLSKSPSLLSINGPISKQPIRVQRNRSSSVSSSISSISTATTATTSSIPRTPTSPSLSPSIGKKFKPHHQCIVEDNEPESEPEDKLMGLGESMSLRRRDPSPSRSTMSASSVAPILSRSLSTPKRPRFDTGSCGSSSKSVKFVDKPTVHYASGGYDPDFWHVPGESMDTEEDTDDNRMDVDDEDDNATETGHHHLPYGDGPTISHPYARASPVQMDIDELTPKKTSSGYRPEDREMLCITPTPERVRERDGRGLRRIVSKSIKRQPASGSTWRSAPSSSSSPSRSTTPRPAISGPFVLGSTSSPYGATSCPPRGKPRSKLEASGIALRSAPSLESFRSVKSSSRSIRSLRSLRSLKSLPESMKSSIEEGAREMKEWFKGRMSIGVSAM
ncbi:hypothetical protein V5O48_000656 [Marasmius crinis-equi]|uniref:Uncharacterized protein n=1 Tax=Marasmius crinis-equi TaxID=585013 RepID=A0ABR3G0X3_9AGAR